MEDPLGRKGSELISMREHGALYPPYGLVPLYDMTFQLAPYLARIGLQETALKPTLATLQRLHRLHPQAIPFENLDPMVDRPVPIDLASVQDKLVKQQRGGYCFEQNTLFKAALEEIGFPVKAYGARVLWGHDKPQMHALSHFLLGTTVEGRDYIVDVGFGKQTLSGPLLLETGVEQKLPLGVFRLEDIRNEKGLGDATHLLSVKLDENKWKAVYMFNLRELFREDMEAFNWFTSTNPNSVFKKGFMVARHGEDHLLSMHNCTWSKTGLDGKTERHQCKPEQLPQVLKDVFGIKLDDDLSAAVSKSAAKL